MEGHHSLAPDVWQECGSLIAAYARPPWCTDSDLRLLLRPGAAGRAGRRQLLTWLTLDWQMYEETLEVLKFDGTVHYIPGPTQHLSTMRTLHGSRLRSGYHLLGLLTNTRMDPTAQGLVPMTFGHALRAQRLREPLAVPSFHLAMWRSDNSCRFEPSPRSTWTLQLDMRPSAAVRWTICLNPVIMPRSSRRRGDEWAQG